MAEMDLRDILLIVVAVAAVLVILYMALRILFKAKKGSSARKTKKSKVLKAIPPDEGAESDSIFKTCLARFLSILQSYLSHLRLLIIFPVFLA